MNNSITENQILAPEENASFDRLESRVRKCVKCRLSQTRTNAVPGMGSRTARIMFVGEGPGKNEDLQGLPFVGAAGKFLDELLASIGLKREDIYITNIVKCRPPENREPQADEVKACLPYLRWQTKFINPGLICTLGNSAGRSLVKPDLYISKEHGNFIKKKGFTFCVLYHPAAALYQDPLKQVLRQDFIKLGEFLEKGS
jgi:uracil-DNA glycosylase